MNSDIVIFLLMVLFWGISQVMAWFGRRARAQQAERDGTSVGSDGTSVGGETPGSTLQEALRDLADQMGIDVETEPKTIPAAAEPTWTASEHRQTSGEHQQTMAETRPTVSETLMSATEHQRTRSESRRTSSEEGWVLSEHQWTPGEHERGDGGGASIPRLAGPRSKRTSLLTQRLRRDLASRNALAKAVVLRDVLGPPVSLRAPTDDRF